MNNTTDTPTTDPQTAAAFDRIVRKAISGYSTASNQAVRVYNDTVDRLVLKLKTENTRAELLEQLGAGYTSCNKTQAARILAGRLVDDDPAVEAAHRASSTAWRYLRLLREIEVLDNGPLKRTIVEEGTY